MADIKKKDKKEESGAVHSSTASTNSSNLSSATSKDKKSTTSHSSEQEDKKKSKEKEKENHQLQKEAKKDETTETKDEDAEDTGEDEVVVEKADKVGYMEMRVKEKSWRAVYCVLVKGSFFYYKNAQDPEPTGSIALKKTTLHEKPEGIEGKKFVITLEYTDDKEKDKNVTFIASLGGQSEFEDWIQALKKNKDLDESAPPAKERRKRDSVMTRMKKRVAGNAATSPLGKKVVKSIINEETSALLNALKRIIKKVSGQKKADEIEKNIIKIAIKSFMLVENKKINGDEFLAADAPLREAFELLIKCYNAKGRVQEHVLKDALKRVEGVVKRAEQIITGLLAPHLTNKNMFRLQNTFGYLSNADFLQKVLFDPTLESEVEKLIDAMEYYTQFHYHV